ncbi:cytochrome-c peroxidase [Roseibium album]|uniref:Cytochrome c551 peroxidase n=1 Tax=Roseibium album TaxID=311410 RepID=A0A0M7B0Z4_9HYPH|nr:cytochrome c peroxidase [Roseibium album]MBG6205231.1 cytochrome c peroxidase [Labrenzia sp. EL_13]CTQ63441.1 Cytochrome c551 peroxidase precursor [Roseibium album]CTQ69905.1 Cytochrome c551 peroxidase precursor [Roseibium album]CTQ81028.1 Cytochrome c551 peroxidase precursor [Roseibium album]
MSKAMKKTVSAWALAGASALAIATGAIAADRPAELAPLGDPPIPADNPQTPEKIELGKMLFFDPRLSGNGAMPCSACHLPDAGWDFPDKISLGYPGTVHWRNSQTIVNSAYYGNLFWAGSSKSLEAQARSAAKGAVAGNGEDDMLEARLAFVPEYRERFKDVFGTEYPRLGHAWMAIAAFERTLVQTDTPFDNYMRGDDAALDEAQKRGLELFTGKAGCSQCHNGALLTNQKYYNLGVPPYDGWETDEIAQITFRYELYAKGSTEEMYRTFKDDPGAYFRAKDKNHLGKFRVPSLRYTKYTAPYMHNGMIETLEDVVEFYNQGGGENEFAKTKSELIKPLGLNDDEKADLVAFLESLTGERIVMEEPELPEYDVLPAASN